MLQSTLNAFKNNSRKVTGYDTLLKELLFKITSYLCPYSFYRKIVLILYS